MDFGDTVGRLVSTADTSDVLAAIALAVAIASLAISAVSARASAVSARASVRSAQSAQQVADTEAMRLRQERAPRFEVVVSTGHKPGHYGLRVKSLGPIEWAYCAVEISATSLDGLAQFTGRGGLRPLKQFGSLRVGEVVEEPFVTHDSAEVDFKFSVLDRWRGDTSKARGEWTDPPNLADAQVYVEHVALPTRDS